MAQIRTSENIAKLAKTSATTLSFPASVVNVGGQQYRNVSALTLALGVIGAGGTDIAVTFNKLYYVYAVISSGALALVASTSSPLPSGFTQVRLVGHFYTDPNSQIERALFSGQLDQEMSALGTADLRNLIINGSMDFWQRGTTISNRANGDSAVTGTYSTADRFKWSMAGPTITGRMGFSQDTDVPTFTQSQFNYRYSYLATCSTADAAVAAADLTTIRHVIEGQDYAQIHGGKGFRLQFWVKSSLAGTYCLTLKNATPDRFFIKEYVITSANAWQKVSIDLNSDNTGTWVFDNTLGLSIGWVLKCGSNFQSTANAWQTGDKWATTNQVNFLSTTNTFRLTGIALYAVEANGLDLPFYRAGKDIQQELAMCQRYYETTPVGVTSVASASIFTNQTRSWYSWKVQKRAAPTSTIANAVIYIAGINTVAVSPDVSNTFTNGVIVIFSNTTTRDMSYMHFYDVTADAEL